MTSNIGKVEGLKALDLKPPNREEPENSHLPFRRRERVMQGFRSPRYLQRFVSVFSAVRNLFVPPRSRRSARATYLHRLNAMAEWEVAANVAA